MTELKFWPGARRKAAIAAAAVVVAVGLTAALVMWHLSGLGLPKKWANLTRLCFGFVDQPSVVANGRSKGPA